MEDESIGRRVAYWRGRRRMSQQMFADRLGKSKSWVDKVERGVRQLDRFSVISEIADVLQLDVQVLMGRDPVRQAESAVCIDQVDVVEIRAALERYDKIGPLLLANVGEVPSLTDLRKAVDHAWLTFQHSKYAALARLLPRLLRDAQAANSDGGGGQPREAAHLLGEVYQISSATLRKLGEYDLAWLAADRSLMVCQRAEDDLLACLATTAVASALSAMGRIRPALEMNVNIASQIMAGRDQSPQRWSVYGMLLLNGAMSAARLGDCTAVRELVAAATRAADQVGGDANYYWTAFGPTNVAFHEAAADVELGEGARAVAIHEAIPAERFSAMMPERRAQHLLDLSRGLIQVGDYSRAGETLIDASRTAPGEIRCRPVAHELIADLLRRTREAPPVAVSDLAGRMGLPV